MSYKKYLDLKGFSKMEQGSKLLLEGLSEIFPTLNLSDPNFIETPHRIAKMYVEMCQGLGRDKELKDIFAKSFPTTYQGIVTQTDITCFSLCPHHFLPVKYSIDFGYVPEETAIGLSKVSRFITILAQQPMLQETFTKEIINTFVKYVKPKGCIVIVRGIHNCIQCRGSQQVNSTCITSQIHGCFIEQETRNEFLLSLKRISDFSR
jgi:GTP cyclohydrolase I